MKKQANKPIKTLSAFFAGAVLSATFVTPLPIDTAQARTSPTEQEAYAIASVAGDLRIHEIVDAPNWVVGLFIPESIFH